MFLLFKIGITVIIGGLLLIVLSIIKLVKILYTNNPSDVGLFAIWLIGILTFLTGLLNQVINIRKTFEVIAQVGDVNASLVADGISQTYSTTISGLLILIVSLIIWGVLKTIRDSKK